jgi:hypothetical protein
LSGLNNGLHSRLSGLNRGLLRGRNLRVDDVRFHAVCFDGATLIFK